MSAISQQNSSNSVNNGRRIADFIAQYGIFLILLAMVVAMTILTPIIRGEQFFLTTDNLIQVLLQGTVNATIAVGMTFVITSGGIDLSVGSMVALCGVAAALFMRDIGGGAVVGIIVTTIVGTLCGLFNGILITRINLSPFIVTLGTMGIFRGLALVISEGRSIYGFSSDFVNFFSLRIGGEVPIAILIAAIIAVIFWFVLGYTKFGKYTVAIGGNEETARLAGIPVGRYKLGIYALAGFLTGIASTLLLARLRSGDPTFGRLFELDAIAATVMGGTSLSGGEGSITGTIVGALIISLVRNAMNLYNIESYWQEVIIGTVIVLAVVLDHWRKQQGKTE